MEKKYAVCSKPLVWGEVVWIHSKKVRILVGFDDMKTCDAVSVEIFTDKHEAELSYQNFLVVAERMKIGL